MKLIAMLLLCINAFAQPNFEGIKFGTPSESFKGLMNKESMGSFTSYTKQNDAFIKKYLFLSKVVYSFSENKLYMIILTSPTNQMDAELKKIYGQGDYSPDGKLYWERDGLRINSEYKDGTYAWFVFDIESLKKILV